jgi:amino acid adenylation domain-containing protein
MTFGRMLNLLKIKRDPSRIPLIPVSFNVDLGITDGVEFKDCDMQFSTNPRHYENHEIFINAAGKNDTLTFECTFNTDLFERTFIESRLHGFIAFIKDIVNDTDMRIGQATILSEYDKELLNCWKMEAFEFDREQTIVSLFNTVVTMNPDRIAIDHYDRKISYHELQATALKVAGQLKRSGVNQGDFVGICMGRTPVMVASMLGVMYAGGAYVPLDTDYPENRLRFILDDSGCKVVVVDDSTPDFILKTDDIQHVRVDEILNQDKYDHDTSSDIITPDSASYVIYTSGSTGIPKGVVIEHKNAVALFAWARTVYDHRQLKGVVAATSICFDLSVFEIFNTLVSGGTMILIDDITRLPDIPDECEPTLVNSVPSAIRELTHTGFTFHRTINTVNLAGEPLAQDLVDRLYDHQNIKFVYDLYGPSEDTTYSTWKLRDKNGPEVIGKVLPNSKVFLVDEQMNQIQPGLVGEILLAGDKVARGYLRRDELTAERFLKNPFGDNSCTRVYRTGDLAKFNKDGDLVFRGRTDHQVKIRGHRIEPGEIEARLLEHKDIEAAVCVSCKDPENLDSLACYYTANSPIGNDVLNSFVSETLPAYMTPSFWIFLKEMPVTLNGKVDRKRLPDPVVQKRNEQAVTEGYSEPEGPFEEVLSVIFSEVLGMDQIGRDDDFFELGGHSLLGVRVTNLIQSQLGIKIALPVLFTAPTIRKLAGVISGEESGKSWSSMVPLKKDGNSTPLFCVHMHNGNIHRWRVITKYMDEDQPVYAIQPRGLDPKQEPHRSVEEMARYYVDQIREIQPHGPYRLLGLCFSGMVVFEMAVILEQLGEQVEFLCMVNNYAPPENPTMYKLKTEWNKFMRMEIGEKFNYAIQKNRSLGRRLFVNRDQQASGPVDTDGEVKAERGQIGNDLRSVHSLALLNYHPVHTYNSSLTIIRTDEPIEDFYNENLGWDRLIRGQIRSHIIEGCDNDTIITDHPYNMKLSVIIRDHLRALEPGKQGAGTTARKNSPGGASSAAIL